MAVSRKSFLQTNNYSWTKSLTDVCINRSPSSVRDYCFPMIKSADTSICHMANQKSSQLNAIQKEKARDFARNLMVTLAKDEMPISDTEFDEEILDDLAIDPFSDVRGLIALFYRNLWAMANLRETLKNYEGLEEQGRLVKLPCKDVYYIVDINNPKYAMVMKRPIRELAIYEIEDIDKENCKYFSTEEKAEARLKELRGNNE